MSRSSAMSLFVCASLTLSGSGGCIALGVPSERFHDPMDHGGLLGDWRPGPSPAALQQAGFDGAAPAGVCTDLPPEYPLDVDPVTGLPIDKTPPPPTVPWPRYHPVPTRPVFGG